MPSDARSAILAKVRSAIHAGNEQSMAAGNVATEWAAVPRGYRTGSTMSAEQLRHQLTDRLHDYDAQVLEAPRAELTDAIAKMLRARSVSRILIPEGLAERTLPEGFDFVVEAGLSSAEMNLCEGVLTESTLAIAETGTIVLQNTPGQGRRAASLVPDYHLCLVDVGSIVATVPEAIAKLQATATLPTTFISGPSATADIEMTRIKGVHGPRFLDVILISNESVPSVSGGSRAIS